MAHFCNWQVMLAISWEFSGAVDSSGTAVFGLSKWLELLTAGWLISQREHPQNQHAQGGK